MWVTFAAGYSAVYQALVVVLAGVILYAFLNARRGSRSPEAVASNGAGLEPPTADHGQEAAI